jgi:hypothetical protein
LRRGTIEEMRFDVGKDNRHWKDVTLEMPGQAVEVVHGKRDDNNEEVPLKE